MKLGTGRFVSNRGLLLLLVVPGMALATTLPEAYEAALAKTEPVQIRESQIEQADQQVAQATGAMFPQISLLANYRKQDQGRSPTAGATNAFTLPDQYSTQAQLVQPLFRGFGEWAERSARSSLRDAAHEQARWERVVLYRNVTESFFAVLAAETEQKNLAAQLELTKRQVTELKQRVRIGRSRLGEMLRAQTAAAQLEAQLAVQEATLASARETFKQRTGLTGTETLHDTGLFVTGPTEPVEKYMAEVERRPDLAAARHTAESAEDRISVARAIHLPSIDFVANYYFKRTGILQNSKWDVGGTLTWPLFQGGTGQAVVRERAAARKVADLQLATLRRSAEQEVRSAYATAEGLRRQWDRLDEALVLAERNYEEQKRDFRNGLVANLEVLQALQDLETTRRTRDRVGYDLKSARARLEASVGRGGQTETAS